MESSCFDFFDLIYFPQKNPSASRCFSPLSRAFDITIEFYYYQISYCEHTCILRALVEHPQGSLEEILQETLQSTQEEPVGRQDRKT